LSSTSTPLKTLIPTLAEPDFGIVFQCSSTAQAVLLPDSLYTVVAANDEYLRLTGLKRQELIGRGLLEVFGRDVARSNVFQQAVLTKARAEQMQRLYWADDDRFGRVVNVPILDAHGSVTYLLHSVEEISADKNKMAAESRFRQMTEVGVCGVMVASTADRRILYANSEMLRMLGYSQADVAAGTLRWDTLTPPEYSALDEEARLQVRANGRSVPFEKEFYNKSGGRVPVLVNGFLLEYGDGSMEGAAFVVDLTDRKRNERDAFLVRFDDAIRSLADPEEITRIALALLAEHLGVDRCGYCIFEPDQDTFSVPFEFTTPGTPKFAGSHKLSHFGPDLEGTLRQNLSHIVNDVSASVNPPQVKDALMQAGIGAMISSPLFKNGRLVAVIGAHQKTPRVWLRREVELLEMVTNRCWESIERAQVARALQLSERRLRLAQRAARIGSFDWLLKENRIFWTPELEALYGLPEGTLEGDFANWKKRVVAEDFNSAMAIISQAIAKAQTECEYEFRVVLADGRHRWLRGRAQIVYDEFGAAERMVGVNIDIDRQKRAEDALRQSEERLRAIFGGTHEHIGLLSPDGTVLEANRASIEFAGSLPEDVVGLPFWQRPLFQSTPDLPEVVRNGVLKAAAGELVHFETEIRRPGGELRTFDFSLHPIKNDAGEVILIVPEGRDITERKNVELQLKQQWEVFDTALSNTPDITYTFDPEGRFTYANRQLIVASQRSLQGTVGKTVYDLGYPPELAARIMGQVKRVVEGKERISDETPFRLPTGEIREYEYIYVPVLSESGDVRAIAGASRDITERKLMERRLRESESLTREWIDAMPQLVWSTSADGTEDLYNKKWYEYTGLSHEESVRQGWQTMHPDDWPNSVEKWAHSLRTGDDFQIEQRIRRFDGQYRWFLVRASCVRDEDGKIVRWFGASTDIHEQKESETALRRAHRELEEFSYVASHDLQEPLRMVNVYSQLIIRELGAVDGRLNQFVGFVRQGATRMETLLQDLLTFSRTAHMEALPTDVSANLSESLTDALSALSTRIEDNSASITAGPLPTVRGDVNQLSHVFQNLISNALKYRKKDVAPQILIAAVAAPDEWCISVRDNGIGFDPEYAERIFGLFKRLHKDEYPGTGLGLAICKRIVERYGGRIWAEGTLGQGATFYFALPKA
jgi:PAS domain S-box-containing protein